MASDKRKLITYMPKEIMQRVLISIEALSEVSVDTPGAKNCIIFLDNNYQNHCIYANTKKGCIKRLIWNDEKDGKFDCLTSDQSMEIVKGNVLILKITLL